MKLRSALPIVTSSAQRRPVAAFRHAISATPRSESRAGRMHARKGSPSARRSVHVRPRLHRQEYAEDLRLSQRSPAARPRTAPAARVARAAPPSAAVGALASPSPRADARVTVDTMVRRAPSTQLWLRPPLHCAAWWACWLWTQWRTTGKVASARSLERRDGLAVGRRWIPRSRSRLEQSTRYTACKCPPSENPLRLDSRCRRDFPMMAHD